MYWLLERVILITYNCTDFAGKKYLPAYGGITLFNENNFEEFIE